MASSALLRWIPSPVLSSQQVSQYSRVSQLAGPQLRQAGWREGAGRVVRVRGFAGEGGAGKEDEAGENGKSGAAVVESSSASTKGFGASARPGAAKPASKEKKKAATVRRSAPENPLLQSAPADNQVSQLETVYVALLTFLIGLIFVEGIALAASGFLPEDWDQFLVNSLYPSFTPTVGLFFLLAAGYGVFKYFGLGSSQK